MRLFKLLSLCFLLSACVFGTSPEAKFYTLSSLGGKAVSNEYQSFVGVNRIRLPKYIDRPQIVTQKSNSSEVVISEYNRWADSLSVLVTRTLTEDLTVFLPKAHIKTRSSSEKFDVIIAVEVVKMNAVLNEYVELDAWYMIKDKTGKLLTRQKFKNKVNIGDTYDDLATGYSQLWKKLAQNIARNLIKI